MASNKPFRAGPIALTNTYTTNILNPGTTTGGTNCTASPYANLFLLIRKVAITNKTAGAVTVRLFLGATGANAAGTEFLFYDYSVPANSYIERFCYTRLDVADFIVGGASAATSLTIHFEGEIGIA